jgi:hypothetical protein
MLILRLLLRNDLCSSQDQRIGHEKRATATAVALLIKY